MIIGLTGHYGSGKDLTADYLVQEYEFTKYSWATKVKECCAILLNVHVDALEELKNDPNAKITLSASTGAIAQVTVRQFYQRMGTDVGRELIYNDIWVDLLGAELEADEVDNVVIADCRFQNEIDFVTSSDGHIIRLERNTAEGKSDSHRSEAIDSLNLEGCWIIENDYETKEELYRDIDALMEGYGYGKS